MDEKSLAAELLEMAAKTIKRLTIAVVVLATALVGLSVGVAANFKNASACNCPHITSAAAVSVDINNTSPPVKSEAATRRKRGENAEI